MKKILIIENSIAVTGALKAIVRTSQALNDKYEFIFVLPRFSKASALLRDHGFQVIEIPMLELSRRWRSVLFYLPTLIRSVSCVRGIVKKHNIALVHVNDFYNLIMPVWRWCGGTVPYVCHVNFVPNRFPKLLKEFWIRNHLKFSAKIIAVSNHVLQQLPASDKLVCISNALPSENVNTEYLEKETTLLFVGNFMKGKGQDLAIHAFAAIAKSFPVWKLRFIGGDMGLVKNKEHVQVLMRMSEELKINTQIDWIGFSLDVATEYARASIALNFSDSESFSLTVQEAMFYGCPVIATKSGGPGELIENDYSGLLVDRNDIDGMTRAIKYLIENPSERRRLMQHARESIRKMCGKEKTVDRLDSIYQTIISR